MEFHKSESLGIRFVENLNKKFITLMFIIKIK